MNVNAFKYLVNLRTFQLPKIDREIAEKLCQHLESLDIMQLTSEAIDLSCFQLAAGSTFDESAIRIGQTTLSSEDHESDGEQRFFTSYFADFRLNYLVCFMIFNQIYIKLQQIHHHLHQQNPTYWQLQKRQLLHLKKEVKTSGRKYRPKR